MAQNGATPGRDVWLSSQGSHPLLSDTHAYPQSPLVSTVAPFIFTSPHDLQLQPQFTALRNCEWLKMEPRQGEMCGCFFFNDTLSSQIYILSLHLPLST